MSTNLTISKADVVALAPELGKDQAIDDGVWKLFIGYADGEVGCAIADQGERNRCGANLVAHFITGWKRRNDGIGVTGQPAGPLESVKVGEVEKSYAVPEAFTKAAMSDAALMTTSYGVEFLRLIRLYMGGSFMVSGGLGPVPGPGGYGWGGGWGW